MDKYLRPARFDASSDDPTASSSWTHWLQTFNNFLASLSTSAEHPVDKLQLLVNYIAPSVYEHVSGAASFDDAVAMLKRVYTKPKNEVFARHTLYIRRQQTGESVSQYVSALKILAKDCNFQAATAQEHQELYVRDAFINGLQSSNIRQRLLENDTLSLTNAVERLVH